MGMFARAKKVGTSLPRPSSIYTKRWSRIRNVKRASSITGKAVRRLSILSLSSLSPGGVHNTPEEADEVVYHVGFQVDLTEQPNAILQSMWDGSYIVNYGAGAPAVPSLPAPPPRECKVIISKDLQALLLYPAFVNSLPISTSAIAPTFENTLDKSQLLNLILLEYSPDFLHVLSLKGFFLYPRPIHPECTRVRGRRASRKIDNGVLPSSGSRTPHARAKRIVGP